MDKLIVTAQTRMGMKIREDLGKEDLRCPHCGSFDLQRDNQLAQCDYCGWPWFLRRK